MESFGDFGHGATADEPHGVERSAGRGVMAQLVDRHDARVFELPSNSGFAEEPIGDRGRRGVIDAEFFEGDVPADLCVPREPDASHPAGRVQGRACISRAGRQGLLDHVLRMGRA